MLKNDKDLVSVYLWLQSVPLELTVGLIKCILLQVIN